MKRLIILLAFSIVWNIGFSQNTTEEETAIKEAVLTGYVEGLQNEGDSNKINFGIHHDFVLLGIDEGNEMWKYHIKEWKAKQVKKKEEGLLPPTEDKMVSVVFKNIDITGTAASVKLELGPAMRLFGHGQTDQEAGRRPRG